MQILPKNIEFFISNNSSNICVTARYFEKQTNIPQIKKSLSSLDFLSEFDAPDKILRNQENNKYYCSECSEINENISYYNSQEHLLFEHTVLPFIEWFNEKITLESKIYFWRHKNSMSSSFVLLNEKEIIEKKRKKLFPFDDGSAPGNIIDIQDCSKLNDAEEIKRIDKKNNIVISKKDKEFAEELYNKMYRKHKEIFDKLEKV